MENVKIPATVRRNKNNRHNREYGDVGSLSIFFYGEHGELLSYNGVDGHSECCYRYMLENTEPVKKGDVDFNDGMVILETYTDGLEWEFEFRSKLNREYTLSKWGEISV